MSDEQYVAVSIVSVYGLEGRGSIQNRQRVFPLTSASRPALGPTQSPVQWVPGALSPGGKAGPGRDADHSPPSSAEVKKEQELYLLSPRRASMERSGASNTGSISFLAVFLF
jgi:hypothetical protein